MATNTSKYSTTNTNRGFGFTKEAAAQVAKYIERARHEMSATLAYRGRPNRFVVVTYPNA